MERGTTTGMMGTTGKKTGFVHEASDNIYALISLLYIEHIHRYTYVYSTYTSR